MFDGNSAPLKAKILEVTAQDRDHPGETAKPYMFKAYEFANGAIMIPGESTPDWFFDSREEIEPCGLADVLSVEDTGETSQFTLEQIRQSIADSCRYYESDSGTKAIAALVRSGS